MQNLSHDPCLINFHWKTQPITRNFFHQGMEIQIVSKRSIPRALGFNHSEWRFVWLVLDSSERRWVETCHSTRDWKRITELAGQDTLVRNETCSPGKDERHKGTQIVSPLTHKTVITHLGGQLEKSLHSSRQFDVVLALNNCSFSLPNGQAKEAARVWENLRTMKIEQSFPTKLFPTRVPFRRAYPQRQTR